MLATRRREATRWALTDAVLAFYPPPKRSQAEENIVQSQDDEGADLSEGFWREFFLLRPERPALKRLLEELGPGDMLVLEEQTRELFAQCVEAIKGGRGVAEGHALDVSFPSRCPPNHHTGEGGLLPFLPSTRSWR